MAQLSLYMDDIAMEELRADAESGWEVDLLLCPRGS